MESNREFVLLLAALSLLIGGTANAANRVTKAPSAASANTPAGATEDWGDKEPSIPPESLNWLGLPLPDDVVISPLELKVGPTDVIKARRTGKLQLWAEFDWLQEGGDASPGQGFAIARDGSGHWFRISDDGLLPLGSMGEVENNLLVQAGKMSVDIQPKVSLRVWFGMRQDNLVLLAQAPVNVEVSR